MRKIGQIIISARKEKKYSYEKLEEITKIKASFIKDLENENWQVLPPFPTVLGFVKSIASALDVDEATATAILKRDYTLTKTNINPKPDISSKQSWNPRITFILGIALVVIFILGYLGFQYKKFVSPPSINVVSPVEGQIIAGDSVLVFGSTDVDVKITVDNQPVLVDEDGKFSVNIEIADSAEEITIVAQSRSGKTTTVSRKINVRN